MVSSRQPSLTRCGGAIHHNTIGRERTVSCWKFKPEKRISLAGSTKAMLIFHSCAIEVGVAKFGQYSRSGGRGLSRRIVQTPSINKVNKVIETYSFEQLGAWIQILATRGFFRKDDQEKLNRRFPDPRLTDVYLHTQPYKFGIYWMMLDRNRSKSGQYHLALESRAAFELLKRLVDLLPDLNILEGNYLRKLLRAGIGDDGKDIASVLTEIDAYVAFKEHVGKAQIGDGKFSPDIQLTDARQVFDIHCKSVGLSLSEIAEVKGMYDIIQVASARLADLSAAKTFLAWHIKPGCLSDTAAVKKAAEIVSLTVDLVVQGVSLLPERSEYIDLIGYSHSSTTDLKQFLDRIMPKPSPDRVIPVMPEMLADWSQTPLSHAYIFCSIRNAAKLAERATRSFCGAMDQHTRMKSTWPIVYLNIENPRVMQGLVSPAEKGDAPNEHSSMSAASYQAAIFAEIRKTDEWKRCKGLILTSPLEPRAIPEGGVTWLRVTSFFPQDGLSEAEALPAFLKVRAQSPSLWGG